MNKDFRERMDRLEELAGKARQREYESLTENINCYGRRIGVVLSERGEYISAANPAMILEMIAELRRLEKKFNDKKAHIGTQAARIKILEDNYSRLQEAYRKLDKEADWLACHLEKKEHACEFCTDDECDGRYFIHSKCGYEGPDNWREAACKAMEQEK